jgi:hypothetical protein
MRAFALALAVVGCRALQASAASTGNNTGSTIIYVAIGIVVLLFLLAAFLVWRCHRNRARQREERAMTGGLPPSSSSNAFRLEIGGGEETEAEPRPRDQRPPHRHKHHIPSQPNGGEYEQQVQAPAVALDAFQDARLDVELHPTDVYYPVQAPLTGTVPAVPEQVRRSAGRQYGDNGQPYQEQQYEHPRGRPEHDQGRVDRVGSDQPANLDYTAQAAAEEKLRLDNARAKERAQETLARLLSDFETDPVLARCRIPEFSLYFTRVLSKGAFGEVWLAQLETRQVAVKRILNEKKNDEKEIECFAAEIKLMATFSHPKIVEFVGICWTTIEDLCAVTEYMARGDLYLFLKQHIGKLNWRDHKIFLAEDVADALGYLHGLAPKVIHRDLKSKNILLDNGFRAKLSDFGISRERSVEDTMTAGVGTIYWTAPEVLMGKKYTEKADIYSFGIVMSELDTHQVPYSDKRDDSGKKLQGMKAVQMVIKHNLRPTLSPNCPLEVRELVERCVSVNPDVRPDASELLYLIRRIEDDLE